jgi:hypothetical protein
MAWGLAIHRGFMIFPSLGSLRVNFRSAINANSSLAANDGIPQRRQPRLLTRGRSSPHVEEPSCTTIVVQMGGMGGMKSETDLIVLLSLVRIIKVVAEPTHDDFDRRTKRMPIHLIEQMIFIADLSPEKRQDGPPWQMCLTTLNTMKVYYT